MHAQEKIIRHFQLDPRRHPTMAEAEQGKGINAARFRL
jgi:hypothetical protein